MGSDELSPVVFSVPTIEAGQKAMELLRTHHVIAPSDYTVRKVLALSDETGRVAAIKFTEPDIPNATSTLVIGDAGGLKQAFVLTGGVEVQLTVPKDFDVDGMLQVLFF